MDRGRQPRRYEPRPASRSRSIAPRALVGVAVAALVAFASYAGGADAGAAASDDAILATQSCRVGVQRPTRIVFTCADVGAYIDHLRWTRWGGRVAIGSGTFHYNDCDPSCAGGQFHSLGASIRLYRRRACPERTHLYYRDATLITNGKRQRFGVACPT